MKRHAPNNRDNMLLRANCHVSCRFGFLTFFFCPCVPFVSFFSFDALFLVDKSAILLRDEHVGRVPGELFGTSGESIHDANALPGGGGLG